MMFSFFKRFFFLCAFTSVCYGTGQWYYNTSFEIMKVDHDYKMNGFTLKYSRDKIKWKNFDEGQLYSDDFFYSDLRLLSTFEKIFFRFEKTISVSNVYYIGTSIIDKKYITYIRSDIYEIEACQFKTHFLKFEVVGQTNSYNNSRLFKINETRGKPPVFYMPIEWHREVEIERGTNAPYINNSLYLISPVQVGQIVLIEWETDSIDSFSYEVNVGFEGYGIFTNIPTCETSLSWMPPRTGKYWCMVIAKTNDVECTHSNTSCFQFIDPNDSGNIDSDCDGFFDVEELLHNSDPDNIHDMPVIICCETNITIRIPRGLFFYREFNVKHRLNVVWSFHNGLPEGIYADQSGIIYGTPTQNGSYIIDIMATDFFGLHSDEKTITIEVYSPIQSMIKIGAGKIEPNTN